MSTTKNLIESQKKYSKPSKHPKKRRPKRNLPISGAAIESLFEYEAMLRGFVVSAPRTDHSQYDRVVDTKRKLYRVQVKARRAYGKKDIIVTLAKSNNIEYTENEVDIIAVYIEDNRSWYLFPILNCKRTFRLNTDKDKLDIYKNNWSIFK